MRPLALPLIGLLAFAALGLGVAVLPESSPSASPPSARPVNAVLENRSFRALFGRAPSPNTPERLRLRTHLAYVEALLRSRRRPSLSEAQRARRAALLDRLHEYWVRGRFPRNTEVPGRSPVFIDERGRLCAVGHLIAVSAGRDLAERIDARYPLADVREMEMPAIDRWAKRHGVTRRELAMIQPMYCGSPGGLTVCPPPPRDDQDASALEVTALSASVGASLLNGVLLERGTPSVVGGAVGVVGGGTSLAVGLGDDARYPTASSVAGAVSAVLGGWALTAALRSDEPAATTASHPASTDWSVGPTTMTTVDGTTRPALRTAIRF